MFARAHAAHKSPLLSFDTRCNAMWSSCAHVGCMWVGAGLSTTFTSLFVCIPYSTVQYSIVQYSTAISIYQYSTVVSIT